MNPRFYPRSAVFCRCGAQWFGKYTKQAAINIAHHMEHCGAPVPIQTFELMGYRVGWPQHWTEEERAEVRRASLAAYGKTQPGDPEASS